MRWTILLSSYLLVAGASAQHWAKDVGSMGPDHVADVAIDADGNVYIVGDFSMVLTFDGQTLTSAGARDVVVAKLDAQGELLWMRRAGGSGFDLGLKLALGPNDEMGITGTFTGTADLFGNTVTSNGGTTDLFVALLHTSDGSTQWVRTGGSSAFVDTPGALTISPNGNVVLTGRFKGTATFDAGTLTSPIDPWTQDYGFDVFITSYTGAGVALWLQQGSGTHDEEAVEIVSDAQNNVYVTGQYSDTITFDLEHPNIALNSIFVVKFDAAGQEQWFRKCGGTIYNHVTDMRMGSDGNLLLCGDVQGDMQWIDQFPVIIPSTYNNAYFILRVNTGGTLLNSTVMGSVNEVRSASIAEQADSIVVYGDFQCDFTGLQDAYDADGLFMATGPHDFFVSKHAKSDLSFMKAQQFGGHAEKRAGQVETTPDDALVFCGSYNEILIFPGNEGAWAESSGFGMCGLMSPNQWLTYCDDPRYGQFKLLWADDLTQGFVGRCLVESRQPYDWWDRTDMPPCERTNRMDEVCIRAAGYSICVDTVEACGSLMLYADLPFPMHGFMCMGSPTAGPYMYGYFPENFMFDPLEMMATNTGWYHYYVSSSNGCVQAMDSIYVIIHPPPQALWSGDPGGYVDEVPYGPCRDIQRCDSMWMWVSQLQPWETAQWQILGQLPIASDSIFSIMDGTYILTVTDTNGCSTQNVICLEIIDPYQPPNVTDIVFTFLFNGDTLSPSDTAFVCGVGCASGEVLLTWYIDGVEALPPAGMEVTVPYFGCSPTDEYVAPSVIGWSVNPGLAGWYPIERIIHFDNLPCDSDEFEFMGMDSIYIVPGGNPQIIMPSSLPACAGDTLLLPFVCNDCDSIAWGSNPGIISISDDGDSTIVNAFGGYYVYAYHFIPGGLCAAYDYINVSQAPLPNIYINPINGVICPNDSALVFTYGWAPGTGYEWQGPGGLISADNDSIWVTEPGDYYLTVTTITDCPVSNGPVTLIEFSSPFIQALPSNVICLNGSVQLQVVSGPGAVLEWQAPLSGSMPEQVVDQPGIYTCIVTSCDVQWVLSIEVFASGISAQIDGGPFTLCSGGAITLSGPDSAAQYVWLPGNIVSQELVVDQPGEYQLIVFDGNGCSDTSAVVMVAETSFTEALTAWSDTVCEGAMATLGAQGSGIISWYTDTSQVVPFATGTAVDYGPVTSTVIVYAVQEEGACEGGPVPVTITMVPDAPIPVITGDNVLCAGEALLLSVDPVPGVVYTWNTPQGIVVGDQISIPSVSAGDAGSYSAMGMGDAFCDGNAVQITIIVNPVPGAPVLSGDTVLCAGDDLVITATAQVGSVVHWSTPQGPLTGIQVIVADVNAADAGMYVAWAEAAGCNGGSMSMELSVVDPPPTPIIEGDTLYCEGDVVQLFVSNVSGWQVIWTIPGGDPSSDNPLSFAAQATSGGVYTVSVAAEPCPEAIASITISMDDCDIDVPNVITPNGDGSNDVFMVEGPVGSMLNVSFYNRWGMLLAEITGQVIRWNGHNSVSNEPVPDGVYYYVLNMERAGRSETMTGYVQVLH